MQGAQNVRSESYLQLRRNDEGEAQRRRWTFYEAIKFIEFIVESSKGFYAIVPLRLWVRGLDFCILRFSLLFVVLPPNEYNSKNVS